MSARRADPKSRRKLVQCKKHGLHYDAELHSGCVLCRKENPPLVPAVSTNAWRVWGPFALVIVALAAVAYWQTRPEGARVGAAPATIRLEPRPYRGQIAVLEGRLYDARATEGGAAARDAAEALAAAVRRKERPPVADAAAQRIESYARQRAAGEIAVARSDWEDLREELFSHASWFRNPGAAPAAQATAEPPPVDPAIVASLRQSAERLGERIEGGARAAAQAARPAPGDAVARWNDWATTWQNQLDDVAAGIETARVGEDPGVGRAHAALLGAVGELRALVPLVEGETVPPAAEVAARFDAARERVDEAHLALAPLGGG